LNSCDCKLNENYCYEEIRFILHGIPVSVISRVTRFRREWKREREEGKEKNHHRTGSHGIQKEKELGLREGEVTSAATFPSKEILLFCTVQQ
jgi:hypothetical protein